MIAIIDYDIGNVFAVVNMLQRLGIPCKVVAQADEVFQAERIILPGNGSFDACMRNLRTSELLPALEQQVLLRGVPLLGICVGAQMLGRRSAEGVEPGLGWIDMQVERFPELPDLRVPHMGWNHVCPVQPDHPLTQDMTSDTRFYFVHSYYMVPQNSADVLLQADYGLRFVAGVVRKNIAGVQFHPEKSHRFGKQLLSSFARWVP
ncbi:imidazole glycerol phosphate synthase subunit HisH [Pseudomonas sp. MDMC216]|nr:MULTISPECIES: imidazole glycerol phosphate synthase subunit HisH [unclassified Pseudomonas]MDI5993279.1 imidazole glycerol phosphate synthase subunit HisH [Pseudomonas sp. MDMC216]MDI6006684.1 imidazole glycerol phosphate synthase subunit HisH [Pseudomonas sp. MDMC17]PTC01073.1 imidazole glycerol phosphate synthase subunit HisH [Thalassospira xiamenensis]RAR32216.1 imidazole glycerol phosphate synthase subunit HisH [Pseudomonas sp. MDMC224]